MKLIPLKDIPESLVTFNRERVKNEIAQAIYELMRTHKITRQQLGELLGIKEGSVSRMLSGAQNFRTEKLADILLVLGRTPHVTLGTDFEKIRFPVDEGDAACENSTVTESDLNMDQVSGYWISPASLP